MRLSAESLLALTRTQSHHFENPTGTTTGTKIPLFLSDFHRLVRATMPIQRIGKRDGFPHRPNPSSALQGISARINSIVGRYKTNYGKKS
jgi:hypothetical protein